MNKQARTRGIKHILSQHRRKDTKHPEFANPFYDVDNDGKNVQVSCDGFRLAVLRDFVEISDILSVKISEYNFPNWKRLVDVSRIIQQNNVVELPDLKKLKEYVKELKKFNLKSPYDFGKNQPCINAEFLIDAMEIVDLKTTKAYASGYKNICLLLIDATGNYVYTMGIDARTREKTNLSIRYEEKDGKYIKVTV